MSTASNDAVQTPYVVVARRYRPQSFGELVGQEHVAEALRGAIATSRVGHAYLFTGARGVGKTSSARILAKCLNCVTGPTATPCNECDICKSISTGDDVDVLEIDGASNRGIDEIRELRQKVNVRPSRARFKIYIIDEVHMLTREAFNALLKTLEEPPEHVKFIFCTTEAEKIPITILSRCQRFDFSGIQPTSIITRLRQIAEAEGLAVEDEALELLARRAAGSMRDSQSLLEQLLSCCSEKITAADVHRLLGTAGEQRLTDLSTHLVQHDAAGAIADLDVAIREGVDAGQLIDQLLGYFRDLMVAAVGAADSSFLYVSSSGRGTARNAAQQLGLDTILAAMQILDQTLSRMRVSTYGRTLAELALVRICRLEDLEALGTLIGQLRDGNAPALAAPAARPLPSPVASPPSGNEDSLAGSLQASLKKNEIEQPQRPVTPVAPAASRIVDAAPATKPAIAAAPAPAPVTTQSAADHESDEVESLAPLVKDQVDRAWRQALQQLAGDLTGDHAGTANSIAILAPNRLVLKFPKAYTSSKSYCERPEPLAKLEQALGSVLERKVKLDFELLPEEPVAARPVTPTGPAPRASLEKLYEKSQEPFVQRAVELFKARPVRLTNEGTS
ncbi:MAG: DNA polymerase III subunit gamma/tau [Planctomycetaceae bacterium]|nr:DNA polymerase III subunit gamma/tau [Planctomycetaceae bacterium]